MLQKIRTVERECQRLGDILEDFLRFVRAKPLRLQPSDLKLVVQEMVDFVAPQCESRGIEIVQYLQADLAPVLLDRELIKQALLNLLINAQYAMPQGGQIVLQTRPVDGAVQLDVIDTGVGMDAETMKQLFRPFFSTRKDGSGLGLPTARKIIEAHNGTIGVQSEVGKGTQFTIRLPAGE
jgi:signal transduction histidine kinase